MRWALPAAWALAVGVVLPLAAHLLSRHRPREVAFPTLRFVRATRTMAHRLHALHDPLLWALRALIVLVLAGAAAGPTLVTAARESNWQPTPVRVLVTSAHMPSPPADDEKALAYLNIYRHASIRESLASALEDLVDLHDVPREIIVRWSGARQAIEPADFSLVPAAIGIDLQVVELVPMPDSREGLRGLQIVAAAADADTEQRVLAALPAFGVIDDGAALVAVWPGARDRAEWVARARPAGRRVQDLYHRMAADPRLADASERSRAVEAAGEAPSRTVFAPLARALDGTVLLWGAESDAGPLLLLDSRPSDPLGVWGVAVARDALRGYDELMAQQAPPWTAAEIAATERAPARVTGHPLPPGLDTRWWWAGALVLLTVEGAWRRRVRRAHDVHSEGAVAA